MPHEHIKHATIEIVGALARKILRHRFSIEDRIRDHLLRMCNDMAKTGMSWHVDKLSRWLGFIQGALWAYGLLDVNRERRRTRPLFHAAYKAEGMAVPKSINITEGDRLAAHTVPKLKETPLDGH